MTDIATINSFTANGRLKPGPGVTKAKVAKVKELQEAALQGDLMADAALRETISTSDAIFNAAYLANLQFLPQFDALPRTWSQIADVRLVDDFDPVVLRGLFGAFEGLERGGSGASTTTGPANPAGIAPVVAELETYPYATIGEAEAAYGRIHKRGFKVGYSWESSFKRGAAQFFGALPSEMLSVALDSEDWEVYNALVVGTDSGSQLQAGTTVTGVSVVANAPISKNAISLGITQLSTRQVNGRAVGRSSNGYNVVVALGQKEAVEFALSQQIIQIQDGSFVLSPGEVGESPLSVVESQWVTGTNWYVLPKPGGLRRPVLSLGRLRGNEVPDLRVENAQGSFVGEARVSPFAGSFFNDSIDLRLRIAISGINWDDDLILWSTGAGS